MHNSILYKSALIGTLLLTACANPNIEQAKMAQQTLIGMPKAALLSCAGAPNRSAVMNNMEYFTYERTRTDIDIRGGGGYGFFHGGRHFGYGLSSPLYDWDDDFRGEVTQSTCVATFTMRNGIVERLMYSGDDGYGGNSYLEQCHQILRGCMP